MSILFYFIYYFIYLRNYDSNRHSHCGIKIFIELTIFFQIITDVKEIFLENISDSDLKYKLYYKVEFEQETGSLKKMRWIYFRNVYQLQYSTVQNFFTKNEFFFLILSIFLFLFFCKFYSSSFNFPDVFFLFSVLFFWNYCCSFIKFHFFLDYLINFWKFEIFLRTERILPVSFHCCRKHRQTHALPLTLLLILSLILAKRKR